MLFLIRDLLEEALTHPTALTPDVSDDVIVHLDAAAAAKRDSSSGSSSGDVAAKDYQRLEFLGDAVLEVRQQTTCVVSMSPVVCR